MTIDQLIADLQELREEIGDGGAHVGLFDPERGEVYAVAHLQDVNGNAGIVIRRD